MTLSELINEILFEWAYRVNDGMPDPKNPIHIKELDIVLSEMGLLTNIKKELLENLITEKGKTPEPVKEEEGKFSNPILNKKISYKDKDGNPKDGIVGNLLRQPEGTPARDAAEKVLPPAGSPERDNLNKELGGKDDKKEKESPEDKKDKEAAEKQKQQQAQAMFDPKVDPAMAQRLDKEKEVQAQIAKDAEAGNKEAEKPAKEEQPKNTFEPIPAQDVKSKIPQADPQTFGAQSDIPDGIEKEDLEKFNTDISKVQQLVADAKAKGEKVDINLCDVTVPGTNLYCDDNLGIPRDQMPQFKGKPVPGSKAEKMPLNKDGEVDTEPVFREMLKEKGITTTQTEVPADKLKATQSELGGDKVIGMMGALEKDPNHPSITGPIYVSRDGFVIDGHHRWAAIAAYNAKYPDKQIPMKCEVIDKDIKDAIPMCNKFAEEIGIAAKKQGETTGKAGDEQPKVEPKKVSSFTKLTDKIKNKISKWQEGEKEFFEKGYYKAGAEPRRTLGQAIKDKAKGAIKAIKQGAKREIEEFKTAGVGVGKFFKGEDLSDNEKKALKGVAIKVATTAIFGAAMGGLASGAAGFAKHVAIEFVPHVVAETLLKGAGRAALFADAEGEAEVDANMEKFIEMISKGIEEMDINEEQMEAMVDSYNEKKDKGEIEDTETPEMKEELLPLVDSLIEEIIAGFIDEANPNKVDDPDVTYTPIGNDGKKRKPKTIKYSSAIKYQKDHPAYIAAMALKGKKTKSTDKPTVKGADLFADPEYQKRMAGEVPPQKDGEPSKEKSDVDKDGNIKGTDIKAEPQLDQIPPKFREEVNTKLAELLGEVEAEEKRAEAVVLKSMGLNSKDELTDDNMEDFKGRMKKENKPPNLNLCKVTVPGTNLYCDENKGLKRDEMPQFKGKPVEGKPAAGMKVDPKTGMVDIEGMYRDHLKEKGITISEPMEVPSESLKATQDELVGAQVVSMTKALDKDPKNPFITAPIYVSRDGYIVDGHHRWAAIMGYNMKNADNPIPMKVMVIDDDIDNVIPDAIQFADEQGIERMSGKTSGKDLDKKQEPAKLPEPKAADETPGGKIFSIGGGYYSDTPNGPAQYRIVESVVDEVLFGSDKTSVYLLFEAVVNKTTSRGKKVKVQTIDTNKQKAATAKAKASKNTEKEQPSVAEPSKEKESGRQEMDSPKTEAEKGKMRAFTDKSVTSSLELTKSDAKAQEKQAKDDYEKALKNWERGGKKGPKPQFTKGLGAGSPESRAGESAVVKGCLVLKDEYEKCIAKSKDKDKEGCYLQSREKARQTLESFLGADSYLTDEWIDSAMNTLDLVHDEIGIENIEEIGWDNQQGRALVGSQGHGTSADMFIKAKPTKEFPNGKRIGVSLKKDLKVFVFNGGWSKLEKVIAERGFKLGEKSTMEYYNKRRYEELSKIRDFATKSKDAFCKDFKHLQDNPDRISSKPQNVQSRVNDILKKTGKSDLSKVKCADFIEGIINEKPPSVDSMKIIGDLCKTSTNSELKDSYKKLRALDREMTDGITNDFMKPENQAVVKKLVRDETHISDILFADNPNLDEFKTVFGTEPAISMKPDKLTELFGIQKLHEQYKNEKDPKKKEALKKKMEDIIDSKIVIDNKKGVMSVAICINDKDGKESKLPLFEAKIRTRGFGNSPTFEMPQTVFGGLAYKYGHTRYNEFDDDDKEIVVSSAVKDVEDDFSEDLEFLDDKTSAEIAKRLKDLEAIYPNSPSLNKFKKKYLNSNNQSIQTAKQKAKAKKK